MPTHDWITPHDLHRRIIDRDQVERETRAFMTDMLSDLDSIERLGMLAVLRDAWTETTRTAEGQTISDARAEGISWLDVAAYLNVAEATARRTFSLHGQDQPSRSPAVAEPGHEWVRVPDAVRQGRVNPTELSSLTRTASRKGVTDYTGKRSGHHVRKIGKGWFVELPVVTDND